MVLICPKCSGTDIRESSHRYLSDYLFQMGGRKPVRCRSCKLRFFTALNAKPAHHPRKSSGLALIHIARDTRKKLWAICILAILVLFFLILAYVVNERSQSPSEEAPQSRLQILYPGLIAPGSCV